MIFLFMNGSGLKNTMDTELFMTRYSIIRWGIYIIVPVGRFPLFDRILWLSPCS